MVKKSVNSTRISPDENKSDPQEDNPNVTAATVSQDEEEAKRRRQEQAKKRLQAAAKAEKLRKQRKAAAASQPATKTTTGQEEVKEINSTLLAKPPSPAAETTKPVPSTKMATRRATNMGAARGRSSRRLAATKTFEGEKEKQTPEPLAVETNPVVDTTVVAHVANDPDEVGDNYHDSKTISPNNPIKEKSTVKSPQNISPRKYSSALNEHKSRLRQQMKNKIIRTTTAKNRAVDPPSPPGAALVSAIDDKNQSPEQQELHSPQEASDCEDDIFFESESVVDTKEMIVEDPGPKLLTSTKETQPSTSILRQIGRTIVTFVSLFLLAFTVLFLFSLLFMDDLSSLTLPSYYSQLEKMIQQGEGNHWWNDSKNIDLAVAELSSAVQTTASTVATGLATASVWSYQQFLVFAAAVHHMYQQHQERQKQQRAEQEEQQKQKQHLSEIRPMEASDDVVADKVFVDDDTAWNYPNSDSIPDTMDTLATDYLPEQQEGENYPN